MLSLLERTRTVFSSGGVKGVLLDPLDAFALEECVREREIEIEIKCV